MACMLFSQKPKSSSLSICRRMQFPKLSLLSLIVILFPLVTVLLACSASASASTWGRRACRSATRAGSFTALNTASNPTARCPPTRLLAAGMTHSTPFSARLALENTFPGQSSSTWSHQLLVRYL